MYIENIQIVGVLWPIAYDIIIYHQLREACVASLGLAKSLVAKEIA